MRTKLAVGLRWARLEVVGLTEEWKTSEFEDVKAVQADLLCDCGKHLLIWASEWRGVRGVKDCGCGLSALDQVKAVKCISLPLVVWKKLKAYANKKGLTASKAISDLIMKGVE